MRVWFRAPMPQRAASLPAALSHGRGHANARKRYKQRYNVTGTQEVSLRLKWSGSASSEVKRSGQGVGHALLGSAAVGLLFGLASTTPSHGEEAVERIVLIRHGEKPEAGLGQLNCEGLNRALASPPVIEKLFGKPDAIFAPDPAAVKSDRGRAYDYVRPLATIEPAAIAYGLPIRAGIGFTDIGRLQAALERPALRNGVVAVAWEHHYIEKLARADESAWRRCHGGAVMGRRRFRRHLCRDADLGGTAADCGVRTQTGRARRSARCLSALNPRRQMVRAALKVVDKAEPDQIEIAARIVARGTPDHHADNEAAGNQQ